MEIRRYQRDNQKVQKVIRMCMYQSGKQKVPKGKSEGTKGSTKRFKRVSRMFQKGQPEGTKW
jgi:hypothetical protein